MHFTEFLDDLSQEALLGQLLSDPFLSGREEQMMDTEEELIPSSPVPPHIQAEHSYSLSGDSRPQSPLSHLPVETGSRSGDSDNEDWPAEQEEKQLKMEHLLCESPGLLPNLALTLSPEGPAIEPKATESALTLTLPQTTQASVVKEEEARCTTAASQAKQGQWPLGESREAEDHLAKIVGHIKFLLGATYDVLPTPQNLGQWIEDGNTFSPHIKLEPHEVDQFLNLSPKELEALQMPPTPPSSHGSDTEGSQSPVHPCAPASPTQTPAVLKVAPRASNSLANSPLLTAPHKLQGSGPLLLTEEERRTLIAEGYPVPTKLPLSKSEEKALKKIRRKIKNKISAQESRRKKKEYMDALEKKVETCSNENSELRRKVQNLESTNKSLLQQLQTLQVMVTGKVPRSCRMASTQTSTCLMVVVLCFAVFLGSFYQGLSPCSIVTKTDISRELNMQESYTATVKSRNLLAYEEHRGIEELQPSGLGGDYPEWDGQVNVMAVWHLDQQLRHKQAETQATELHPPFIQNNGTNMQKPLVINMNTHSTVQLSDETPKVIELERTVNKPS
ncbi:cyclic AMP-responsive element-binding protein 3-like protein 2 isoform X2 [Hoplias malabaricus]|uniref:cyclic AMP-responsive element-binding protein 3-like protein 2 isoform X2 n=1 Tax=Hoplias malabaricus TaxID=27720 RepID=UPI0034618577